MLPVLFLNLPDTYMSPFVVKILPEGDTYSFIGSKDPVEVLIPLISNEMSFTVNAFALTVASKATILFV